MRLSASGGRSEGKPLYGCRSLQRMEQTRKKGTKRHKARRVRKGRLTGDSCRGGVDPERLVFVDEMGAHTSVAPLYGYSRKGERVRLEVPRNRGSNTPRWWPRSPLAGWARRWPSRALRPRKSSRLT